MYLCALVTHFSPNFNFMQKLIPALLLFALALVSCGKSNDDDVVAKSPTWVVTLYQIPSNNIAVKEDKTTLFNGYAFEFNDDDAVVITGDRSFFVVVDDESVVENRFIEER